MNKDLKNKIDSIRRTMKNKGLEVDGIIIESKILEMCPEYHVDWCSDVRSEIIKSLIDEFLPHEIETINKDTENNTSLIAPSEGAKLVHHNQPETLIQQENEENTVSAIVPLGEEQENNQLTISNADKQALVNTQSLALGIELSEQETIAIADSIDDVFSDYSSFISNVTSAIKGYIAHRFDTIEDELDNNSNDVRGYFADRNLRVKEKLSNYAASVKSIQTDTKLIRDSLKTSEQLILSRFRT